MATTIHTPGQPLGSAAQFSAGPGTHVRNAHVCASVVGVRSELPPEEQGGKPLLSVSPVLDPSSTGALPRVGDVVIGRVLRVTPRLALVDVACVGSGPAAPRVSGVVRVQDVRGTPGEVALGDCFRRADVVRARVLSLGDARSYFLSTAEPELGVVSARSESGFALRPVSWREMRCERTGALEPRKVAKPKGAKVVAAGGNKKKTKAQGGNP